MMNHEEYVRANWEWVQVRLAEPFEGIAQRQWTARLPILLLSQCGFETEAEAWAAAAEFTRERLEQIRQLEREIRLIAEWHEDEREDAEWRMTVPARAATSVSASLAGIDARNTVTLSRTLARLESALADLKRGMK